MFNVTRLATSATKFSRNLVKNVAKEKIDMSKASEMLQDTYSSICKSRKPYSENIFKRAIAWVQDFVANFKTAKSEIKEIIAKGKQDIGETFSKKDKKDILKDYFDTGRDAIKNLKDEIKTLLEAGKKS